MFLSTDFSFEMVRAYSLFVYMVFCIAMMFIIPVVGILLGILVCIVLDGILAIGQAIQERSDTGKINL